MAAAADVDCATLGVVYDSVNANFNINIASTDNLGKTFEIY